MAEWRFPIFYTIYKITNLINLKYYIGKHQTNDLDDGYMGSGKLIKRAIQKHGLENFKKEILFIFDNEKEMNDKEAELVIISEETYNLCAGGKGGFGYINEKILTGDKRIAHNKKYNPLTNRSRDDRIKYASMGGKRTAELIKQGLIDKSIYIPKISQAGTVWITNGLINKRIKKDVDIIPEGWYKGRVNK